MAHGGELDDLKRAAFGRDATEEDVRRWQEAVDSTVAEPEPESKPKPEPVLVTPAPRPDSSWSLGTTTAARRGDAVSQMTAIMQDEREYGDDQLDDAQRQARRSTRKRRLTIAAIVTAVVLVTSGVYVGWALRAPIGPASATSEVPAVAPGEKAELRMSPEGVSAISIAGGEDYLGPTAAGIFAKSGNDKPKPIASISKLITALVVLSKYPLKSSTTPGPNITFTKADHALYDKYYVQGATIAAMPTGSTLSLHQSLEAMLVASACNYAEAVSTWAFGSQGAFLAATRDWLTKNKLTHTTILEPTGLDARNTSTPSDLIRLGKIAMKTPAIRQIVAMTSLDVPGIPSVGNTNTLLGTNGVNGLKTGTLTKSGSDLLFSADIQPANTDPMVLTVTGVVLGGYSRESVNLDVIDMLNSLDEGFHELPVANKNTVVGTYTTAWGESAQMVLGENATLLTWSDTPVTATIETTTLTTGDEGEEVGSVTYTAGINTVTVPVLLDGPITQPDEWWRITHPQLLHE